MREDLTELIERDRHEVWPPLGADGRALRARGRRVRALRAAGALVAAVAVVAAAAATVTLFDSSPGSERVTAQTPAGDLITRQDGDTWRAFGVSVRLRSGWVMVQHPSGNGQQACLRPAEGGSCPLLLEVAADPASASTAGVDVLGDLSTGRCAANDPKTVRASHATHDGRAATKYVLRCTEASSPVTAWALDDRTVALIAEDATGTEVIDETFRSLLVPSSWGEAASRAPVRPSSAPQEVPDDEISSDG